MKPEEWKKIRFMMRKTGNQELSGLQQLSGLLFTFQIRILRAKQFWTDKETNEILSALVKYFIGQ